MLNKRLLNMYLGGYICCETSRDFQNKFINAVCVSALLDEGVFQPDQTIKKNTQFVITKIQVSFLAEHDNHPSFAHMLACTHITCKCANEANP